MELLCMELDRVEVVTQGIVQGKCWAANEVRDMGAACISNQAATDAHLDDE